QTVVFSGFYSRQQYPEALRRIGFRDPQTGKRLVFLTNNFTEPALTMAQLYRCRWQVELFFKWIKQHLRIKVFYGISENAVRIQVWVRHFGVRLRCHPQKAALPPGQPLHHFTDSEPLAFRENAHFTGSFSTNTAAE